MVAIGQIPGAGASEKQVRSFDLLTCFGYRDPGAGASEKQPRSIRHSSVLFQHHSLFKCIILVILSSYAIRSTAGATTIDGVRR